MNNTNTSELNIQDKWAIEGTHILASYVVRAVGGI